MPRAIFVTGGTSALYGKTEWKTIDNKSFKKEAELFQKLEEEGINSNFANLVFNKIKSTLEAYFNIYRSEIDPDSKKSLLKDLSAELASMLKFEESYGKITNEDKIYLLHSDTVDGELCAKVNAELMKDLLDWDVQVIKIDSLKIENVTTFQRGLNNLKNKVLNLLPPQEGWIKCMNITAGYTGLVPYTTVLAWDYGMDLLYFFEDSTEMLRIRRPSNWPLDKVFDKIE